MEIFYTYIGRFYTFKEKEIICACMGISCTSKGRFYTCNKITKFLMEDFAIYPLLRGDTALE